MIADLVRVFVPTIVFSVIIERFLNAMKWKERKHVLSKHLKRKMELLKQHPRTNQFQHRSMEINCDSSRAQFQIMSADYVMNDPESEEYVFIPIAQ